MIRERIKKEALEQGVSLYQLAKIAKMQQTQLKLYLNYRQSTTADNVERLLKYLNVTLCSCK